jgi:phytol kinase
VDWFARSEIIASPWFQVIAIGAWLAAIVLLAEGLHKHEQADPEFVRKIVHIGTGNVILLAWWLRVPTWMGIAASVLCSAIALLSYRFPLLPGINSVGRKSLGTFFYAVSIGVLMAAFWQDYPQYTVLGILVMTWGDGLAALVGIRFGWHPFLIWGMKKSWEGTLAMLGVSFAISFLVLVSTLGTPWQAGVVAIAVAILATVLESFSKWGVDNITVPVGSAVVAFWLSQVWLSF